MNKKNITYLLVLIAIALLLYFFLRGKIPFGKENASFSVTNDAVITRIDFLQGEKKLSLKKANDVWLINEKEEARKNSISFILKTLKEIKIKSPVSSEIFEKEIISKQIEPVKVNVYSNRRLVKSFFVYKTGSNIYGNIMKRKASSKPFIVYMPGNEDNLGAHFVVNELFWKPFTLFNLLPSQIASIKLENISDNTSSFIVNYINREVSLFDLKKVPLRFDTLKVKRYLSYYTSVQFENWAFDLTLDIKNELESTPPLYKITVKQHDGTETVLTVFEKFRIVDGVRTKDTDRVWGKTSLRDDIFIMRYFDLDPILKKRSYFLKE
jgi:hypothetical protein